MSGRQLALMEGPVDKVGYWLTPPEDLKALEEEFGELWDPCPYPRPAGWDGLKEDWVGPAKGRVVYVNPPFEGPGTGFSKWAKKCILESDKGLTVILIYPVMSWTYYLFESEGGPIRGRRIEIRAMKHREWVSPDGRRRKSPSPLCYFILRPPRDP